MNLFNKYEAIGIFFSVAIMAVALSVLRFQSGDVFTSVDGTKSNQVATVIATQGTNNSNEEIKSALTDAMTTDGTLVRLVVDDVRIGTGAGVVEGDTVSVHYIGTTQSGVKFDSSYERNSPFEFTVGGGKVIEGWEKGLIGMKIGGQRILVIPSEMAYGNRQVGLIPANSPLVFSIELLKIQ